MMPQPVQQTIEGDEEQKQKLDVDMQDEAEEEKSNTEDAGAEASDDENADKQVQMVEANPSPTVQESSYTVTEGATYWFTGLSGAGKSTLTEALKK